MKYTFILGLDVASKKLDLCLLDTESQKRSFTTIEYSRDVLEDFLQEHSEVIPKDCLVGLESTGDYHLKASKFFLEKGFDVKILNPILTNQYIRTTIRGTKTDKTDSELICKLLVEEHGDLLKLDKLTSNSKELMRLSASLIGVSTQLKLRRQSVQRKALDNTENIEKEIEKIIDSIKELSDNIVKQATEVRTEEEEFIDSIPGFSTKLSAVVYHEIGDIDRFPNSKCLSAFAGLDPRIKQSGERLNTTGRITKRGSKYLRTGLFMAANVARMHDTDLKEYYEKKKIENRTHKEIMCMISRKLLARIFVVLKERRNYEKR
ncbi:IS110 family transposase [bacterium]|nr:MAG: IS110 family transposase [bacterium]